MSSAYKKRNDDSSLSSMGVFPFNKKSFSQWLTYKEKRREIISPCKTPILFTKNSDIFPFNKTHDLILSFND
jgi:hypothetical protein